MECTHKIHRFVVNAPIEAYTDHRMASNNTPYGYVCVCQNIGNGIILGENMVLSSGSTPSYEEISNVNDLFRPMIDGIKVVISNGDVFVPVVGNDIPKMGRKKRTEYKNYKIKLRNQLAPRKSYPVHLIKSHLIGECGAKCRICLSDVWFKPSYIKAAFAFKNNNTIANTSENKFEILDEDGATSDDLEIANCLFRHEQDLKETQEGIQIKEINHKHLDESVALKEEMDEEFQTSKRLFIDEQDENKKNVSPKKIKMEHSEESIKKTTSNPRIRHKKLVIVDSEEE